MEATEKLLFDSATFNRLQLPVSLDSLTGLAPSLKLHTAPLLHKRSHLLPVWLLTPLFVGFCTHCLCQAIEEEGGNPDEIVIAPESTAKKATPKRAAKGKEVCARRAEKHVTIYCNVAE